MQYRTGCIYSEYTNDGKHSSRGRSELHIIGTPSSVKFRWVAEIKVNRKRYRFRSTNFENCRYWLRDMVRKYPTWGVSKPKELLGLNDNDYDKD